MSRRRAAVTPFLVLGGAVLLGGWFLQEGVEREENVYLQVRVFEEVVSHVSAQYVDSVERGDLYQSAIRGLLDELDDPNTSFIPARVYDDFAIQTTTGQYGGVGLEVVQRDEWVTVVAPIPGTPAARAGIRPGDWFVEIAGESAEGWPTDRAVEILRGEPGSTVEVMIGRTGVDEPIPFTLERAVIQLRAVPFALELEEGIGYVPLQIFRSTSSSELRAAVDSLRAEGVQRLILDLRGNPGGLLEEGIGVTDLFVDAGAEVVETRGRAPGQSQTFGASEPSVYDGLTVAVLVDGSSASASEIVAGALQDHDRALVVGMPTYGKGSVQTLFQLSGGNVLRLTTARWYTPVGRSIDRDRSSEAPVAHAALTLTGAYLAPEPDEDRPTFRSMAGRTLLGGGGIVPDVTVTPDTLTTDESVAVRALYRQAGAFTNALFSYAVEVNRRAPGLAPGFEVDDTTLDEFRTHLGEAGVEVPADVFAAARRYIAYQIEREVALQSGGDVAEFEQVRRYDRQLARAVELLRESNGTSALLERADPPQSAVDEADSPDASGSTPRP